MPIKLFVDDLRKAPDDSWTVVRTVTEAIRLLATQDVSHVALDHDIMHSVPARPFKELGGLPIPRGTVGTDDEEKAHEAGESGIHFPIACPETFEPVARYIALMPSPPIVTIHTANPAGRARMGQILAERRKP